MHTASGNDVAAPPLHVDADAEPAAGRFYRPARSCTEEQVAPSTMIVATVGGSAP